MNKRELNVAITHSHGHRKRSAFKSSQKKITAANKKENKEKIQKKRRAQNKKIKIKKRIRWAFHEAPSIKKILFINIKKCKRNN